MKIVVTEKASVSLGDMDFSALDELAEVVYYDIVDNAALAETIGDADGVIVNKCVVTSEVMDKCPSLRYIGTFATGYNNIDVAAARERGITVCNVPGYSTDAVAQHVMSFILTTACSTNEYINSVNDGDWKRSKAFCYYPYHISEVGGKTVGIYGYGAIGKRVAELCSAFGMRVIVHSRTKKADCPYPQVSKEELFSAADYLTLHAPLTPDTDKVVNAGTLALMKGSAVLINTARGGLVDEYALADALKEGRIRAAAVDVLTKEPMTDDCPLFGLRNCLITPHVAWAGYETRGRLIDIAAANLRAFINGKPQNEVTK